MAHKTLQQKNQHKEYYHSKISCYSEKKKTKFKIIKNNENKFQLHEKELTKQDNDPFLGQRLE